MEDTVGGLSTEKIKYLQLCKSRSLTFVHVKQELINKGWLPEEIILADTWYLEEDVKLPIEVKKRNLLNPIILFLLLLIIISASGLFAYFIASDKIDIKNEVLKTKISHVIFSLPFVSKTPRYIIESAFLAQSKINKLSFDFSGTIASDDISKIITGKQIDLRATGFSDYSDINSPVFTVIFSIANEFNFDLRSKNKIIYLKINQIPASLFAFLGVDFSKIQPILTENWIALDSSTLNTQPPKESDRIKSIFQTSVLPYLVLSNDMIDSVKVYKFELKEIGPLFNSLDQEINKNSINPLNNYHLSDNFKDLKIIFWIGQKDYLLRKISTSFNVISNSASTSSLSFLFGETNTPTPIPPKMYQISLNLNLILSDFGKDKPVDIPGKFLRPEEIYQKIQNEGSSFSKQINQANNTKRRADMIAIINAIEQYAADNAGKLPGNLPLLSKEKIYEITDAVGGADFCEAIYPTYIASLPVDSSLNINSITTCKKYDTGYQIIYHTNARITLRAPRADLSAEPAGTTSIEVTR